MTAHAEARWLLGEVHLATGEPLSAESELHRARNLGWAEDDVRPALARSWLAQGKMSDVLALEYQDLGPSAAARLLAHQTMAALSEDEPDKARELVTLALDKDPAQLDVQLADATHAVYHRDPAEALALIDSDRIVAAAKKVCYRG